jgi:hypothetical protein
MDLLELLALQIILKRQLIFHGQYVIILFALKGELWKSIEIVI